MTIRLAALVAFTFGLFVACGGKKEKKTTLCEPFASMKIPKVTDVGRCDQDVADVIGAATPEELAAGFVAAGYELGQETKVGYLIRRGKDVFEIRAPSPIKDSKDLYWIINRASTTVEFIPAAVG